MTSAISIPVFAANYAGPDPDAEVCEMARATLTLSHSVCGPGVVFEAKVTDVRSTLVKPKGKIDRGASAFHNITNRMVETAHAFEAAWTRLGGPGKNIGPVCAGYKIGAIARRLPGMSDRRICIAKAAMKLWPDFAGGHGLANLKQPPASAGFTLPAPTRQNTRDAIGPGAAEDAWFTAWLLARLAEASQLKDLEFITKAPPHLVYMPRGKHAGARFDDADALPTNYLHWAADNMTGGDEMSLAIRAACRRELSRRLPRKAS